MPVTKYVWSRDKVTMEKDGSGTTTRTYTCGTGQYGPLVSERSSAGSRFHHFDALGSTRAMTDTDENVTDTMVYDAWGNTKAHTGSTDTPYRYVGKWGYQKDAETGELYVRRRMYDPSDGVWLSGTGQRNGRSAYAKSQTMNVNAQVRSAQDAPGRARATDQPGRARVTDLECTFKLCSTPVDSAATGFDTVRAPYSPYGHLFVICDGTAYRGGPGGYNKRGTEGCEARRCFPFGQLVTDSGPYRSGFIDYMHPDQEECEHITVFGTSCRDLCDCFARTIKSIDECCIRYHITPNLWLGHANSNSTAMWLLKNCLHVPPPFPPIDVGKIKKPSLRLFPGEHQPLPDCVRENTPGKAKL